MEERVDAEPLYRTISNADLAKHPRLQVMVEDGFAVRVNDVWHVPNTTRVKNILGQ